MSGKKRRDQQKRFKKQQSVRQEGNKESVCPTSLGKTIYQSTEICESKVSL